LEAFHHDPDGGADGPVGLHGGLQLVDLLGQRRDLLGVGRDGRVGGRWSRVAVPLLD
jgi:hypothetical protein